MADDADRRVNRESVWWQRLPFSGNYLPFFSFLPFPAMQHWLEFTKSIGKQMKCEYPDELFLIFDSL